MERGGRFHRYRRHAKNSAPSASSAPASGTDAPQEIAPNNAADGSSSNGGAPAAEAADLEQASHLESPPAAARAAPCMAREQDQYMPIANVIRIMRIILPAHAKISDDAKETIQECVSEFISFITGEANDRCQKEQRKTITAEDILWSMGKLGFDEYVEPLTLFLNRHRESESDRSSSRDSILRRISAANFGINHCVFPPPQQPLLHSGAAYPMLPPPPLSFAAPQNLFDGGMVGGFYKDPTELDGAGGRNFGGAGYNPNPNQLFPYDPFSQFK